MRPRSLQFFAAGLVALIAILLAVSATWPFRAPPARVGQSVWQLILSDRATLGFVRLAVLLLALYAISSIAALPASGRWPKGFAAIGVEADDAIQEAAVEHARRELAQAKADRDAAVGTIEADPWLRRM